LRILSDSGLWYLAAMYFCYNYCLATYLDWFPTYLHQYRGYDLKRMGFYASLPLLAGTVGDLAGGWFSDVLLRRTSNVKRSRRVVAVVQATSTRRAASRLRACQPLRRWC